MLVHPLFALFHVTSIMENFPDVELKNAFCNGIEQMHATEWIAAILSFWCVVLAAKNSIWNWPVALIGSMIYAFVFLESALYSDALLNVIFVIFQIYGWMSWRKNSVVGEPLRPTFGQRKSILKVLVIALFIYPFWVYVISSGLFEKTLAAVLSGDYFLVTHGVGKHTQMPIIAPPRFIYIDAMLLFLSLSALYMQAKKWIQNWILWIVVDLIYVPVYWLNHNYITAFLYLIYIPIAVKGYQMWKNESKQFSLVERNTSD